MIPDNHIRVSDLLPEDSIFVDGQLWLVVDSFKHSNDQRRLDLCATENGRLHTIVVNNDQIFPGW